MLMYHAVFSTKENIRLQYTEVRSTSCRLQCLVKISVLKGRPIFNNQVGSSTKFLHVVRHKYAFGRYSMACNHRSVSSNRFFQIAQIFFYFCGSINDCIIFWRCLFTNTSKGVAISIYSSEQMVSAFFSTYLTILLKCS